MFGISPSTVIVDFSNFNVSQLLDAWAYGGAMLLIGMLTIFSVLCLLWLCLVLFKVVFHDLPEKRSAKAAAAAPVVAVQNDDVSETNDSEIVAVIAAAIAMAESEANGVKFKVVSFKRK